MTEKSFGIIPLLMEKNTLYYLLIQHNKGHWGFPKGHVEKNESDIQTACREFTEETGINEFNLISSLVFQEHYCRKNKRHQKVDKTVTYFPAQIFDRTVNKQVEEINDFSWGTYNQTLRLITFDEGKSLLKNAHKKISKLYKNTLQPNKTSSR